MKNQRVSSVIAIIAFTFIFFLTVPTFAVEPKASQQISIYSMNVTPATDKLNVKFSVTANGPANKVGCESIYVYEKSGTKWIYVDSRDEDDLGMSKSGQFAYGNNIYFDSESGTEYKVVVTIFAENDEGRDTRTKTFFVTGK